MYDSLHCCFGGLQVVQEIKVLRSSVSQREKERAERATLVQQERLIKAKVRPSNAAECCQASSGAFVNYFFSSYILM